MIGVCPPNLDRAKFFQIRAELPENTSAGAQVPERVVRRERGVLDKIIQGLLQTRSPRRFGADVWGDGALGESRFGVTPPANKPL